MTLTKFEKSLQITGTILGASIVGISSLQSSIVTLYSNPTIEQKIAAHMSIVGIFMHIGITVCAYLLQSPNEKSIPLISSISEIPNFSPKEVLSKEEDLIQKTTSDLQTPNVITTSPPVPEPTPEDSISQNV